MKRSSLASLFLTVFIDLLGFGIVIPLLPYYARQYGATGATVGMVVAIYSLMQFFFAPIWGRLSDRIGRRPVLLISLTGSALGYCIFAFAYSLPLLFAARIVAGIAAANIGTAQAYIADTTSPENRAKGMGMIGAAFGMGFIFGPPIGGLLSSVGVAHGFHGNLLPGLVASSLSVVAFTFGFFSLRESKSPDLVPRSGVPPQFDRKLWAFVIEKRTLGIVLLSLFLVILAFASLETTVTLQGRDHFGFTARDLGFFFGAMGLLVAVIQGAMIGGLSRRLGERNLVAVGAVSLAVGLAIIPSIDDPRYLYLVAVFLAIGQGLSYPSLTSLVTKSSPRDQQGSVLGISSSVSSMSRVVGPVLGGLLYDWGGARGAFYTGSMIVLAAFALAMVLKRLPLLETAI